METLIKWPQMVENATNSERLNLIDMANRHITNSGKINLHFSGIECSVPRDQASKILSSDLTRENEEYLKLANKFRTMGLQYEGIIKTKFFNKLIRKAGIIKNFYFFTEFDEDGRTWANLEKLRKTNLTGNYERIAEEISRTPCDSAENVDLWMREISAIDHETKNLLWPKHTDKMETAMKRKIKIEIQSAPLTVIDRIICWREKGYIPHLMAHKDSIKPELEGMLKQVIDSTAYKIRQLEHRSLPTPNLNKLYHFLKGKFTKKTLNEDPLLYLNINSWTIIIDQYGDFAQEKEILKTVKEEYSLLGQRYGITMPTRWDKFDN